MSAARPLPELTTAIRAELVDLFEDFRKHAPNAAELSWRSVHRAKRIGMLLDEINKHVECNKKDDDHAGH